MYQEFYQLDSDPFRLSPDHAFCFRYPSFAKAKAYMRYALNSAEGFVMVTGKPGMGKTTLINDLMDDFRNSDYLTANLANTQLGADGLLRMVAYDFGLNAQNLDKATIMQRLKQFFVQAYQSNRSPLLIVDEAQNLTFEALEELRLLTNLQFDNRPLLQIFLVGQEGLRDKIADARLEQLRQRITAACHLDPLNLEQTMAYVIHRLRVVGWKETPKIDTQVFRIIQHSCQGIPRRINQFCSRLLLHGSLEEKSQLTVEDARIVLRELDEEHLTPTTSSHNVLSDISNPDHAIAVAEENNDAEALRAAVEDLLDQQEKSVKAAVSIPKRQTTETPSPIQTFPGEHSQPKSNATPDSNGAQAFVPFAYEQPDATRKETAYDLTRDVGRRSRWTTFAYAVLFLLFLAVTLVSIPYDRVKEWLPEKISAVAKLFPRGRSEVAVINTEQVAPSVPTATARSQVSIANDRNRYSDFAGPPGIPPTQPQPSRNPEPSSSSNTRSDHATPTLKANRNVAESTTTQGAKPIPNPSRSVQSKTPTAALTKASAQPKNEIPQKNTPPLIKQISFGFDSTEIRKQDRRLLKELAKNLRNSEQMVARIVGYTDSVGPKNYNRRLSRARANAVADYLIAQGISSKRLQVEGKGSNEMVDISTSKLTNRPARVVQIVLQPAT